MDPNEKLLVFLEPYSLNIQDLLFTLRSFILSIDLDVNELIWDNYNSVAIAYSKSEKLSDAYCHLAVYAKHVNFGFNRGSELDPGNLKLHGKGKLIRHLKVKSIVNLQKDEVASLIKKAIEHSVSLNPILKNQGSSKVSKVMSISEKKIRPSSSRIGKKKT